MTALEQIESQDPNRLFTSIALAFCIFAFLLTAGPSFFNHKPPIVSIEAPLLEAEIVTHHEPPKLHEAKLDSAKKSSSPRISKQLNDRPKPVDDSLKKVFEESNQTESSPTAPTTTHGPIAVSSPSPKLPEYLKNQNIKASVLIEFLILANGQSKATLIRSSGNEELDALAISTAKNWTFQPAVNNGTAMDSKMRLKINFEVQ